MWITIIEKKMSLCACKQSLKSFLISNLLFSDLYYFLSDCYFLSHVSIFVTFRRNLTSLFTCAMLSHFSLPSSLTPLLTDSKHPPWPSHRQSIFTFSFVSSASLSLSVSLSFSQSVSLSLSFCHSLSLSLSYFWLPHSSHTFRLSCLQNSGHKDCDVQYAELDTAALASSPSPRSSAHTGPGDLVEYATIQPSSH